MAQEIKRTENVPCRLTPIQLLEVDRAAKCVQETRSEFIRNATHKRAVAILQKKTEPNYLEGENNNDN